ETVELVILREKAYSLAPPVATGVLATMPAVLLLRVSAPATSVKAVNGIMRAVMRKTATNRVSRCL
ncbi:MAG: hypothetical protein ACRKGH_04615, partial [Dehalogenimonas sp.]